MANNKIITVVGITGKQGASVADVFLQEGGWHVRGVTRDPAKPESQKWAAKGVELVKANLNDAASLKAAFAGSTVVFGVTDFWGIVGDPEVQKRAQEAGRPVNVLAYDLEVQQGRNIVDAVFATLETIDRFVLSTLSPTKKLSKGKYTHNFHFDAKWEAVEYLKATYPALDKKTSYLQVALYLSNWKSSPLGRPTKQPDNTFVWSHPGDPDAPVAQVDARHDTGLFVKALTQVEPGKHLLGASGFLSWNEFTALWGKVHGVQCRFQRLDRAVLENAIPGGVGEELADMYEYIGDFGYHGGDPSVIFPADLGVDVPFTTLEEFIKKEDCYDAALLGPGGLVAVRNTTVEPPEATAEAIKKFEQDKPKKQEVTDQTKPIIEWHKDSHPWVCVVMLSDARHMSGGETELMKGGGTTLKVKAPQMGCAVLLQGRYITHTAAPVTNMPERVTIVTSFRPKNPLLVDDTTNKNVRNKSHLTELYYQWMTYRLDVIAQRARIAADALKERYAKNVAESDVEGKAGLCRVETVSPEEIKKWSEEMIKYIRDTTEEMGLPLQ